MSTTSDSAGPRCQYCRGYHATVCRLISAIEYHQDGTIKRVEFHGSRSAAWQPPSITDLLKETYTGIRK